MSMKKKQARAVVVPVVLACGLGAVVGNGWAQAGAGLPADPAHPPATAPAAGAVIDKTARRAPVTSAAHSGRSASAVAASGATTGAAASSAPASGRIRR